MEQATAKKGSAKARGERAPPAPPEPSEPDKQGPKKRASHKQEPRELGQKASSGAGRGGGNGRWGSAEEGGRRWGRERGNDQGRDGGRWRAKGGGRGGGNAPGRGDQSWRDKQGGAPGGRFADRYAGRGRGSGGWDRGNLLNNIFSNNERALQPPAQHGGNPAASAPVARFWRRLDQATRGGRFVLDVHDTDLWHQTWAAAAAGAKEGNCGTLLKALMLLPGSSAATPPAEHVVQVLIIIVAQCVGGREQHQGAGPQSWQTFHNANSHFVGAYKPQSRNSSSVLARLTCLEAVADAVRHRLHGCEARVTDPPAAATLVEQLVALFREAISSLVTTPEAIARATTLLVRSSSEMDSYIRDLKACPVPSGQGGANLKSHTSSAAGPVGPWTGWQNPTLTWLAGGAWMSDPQPTLKTRYDDAAQYAQTLHQLMALLTFYWGAGAIWPRCRFQQNMHGPGSDDRKCCNEPLLARAEPNAREQRRCKCGHPAVWGCHRSNHPDGMCEKCVHRQQVELVGRPGVRASTDVYDAVVERESTRREGQVYHLSGLTSRRPPTVPPNWRTTYRLKCSALVAVGRLAASQEPLNLHNCPLQWAEIVPVNYGRAATGPDQDHVQRQRGCMAVRLLSRSDCHILQQLDTPLEAGSRVALIDLRVFVPEVISVLSTLGDPTLSQHLKQIPFVEGLIGHEDLSNSAEHIKELQLEYPAAASPECKEVVARAIDASRMDLIQRLSAPARSKLAQDIANLAMDANLYGTQLEAFCEGLMCSVHCTQGPPGTGKSYVGVQLILALDTIRQVAIQEGHSVGPIITMSYKNHALDELLLDVAQAQRFKLNRTAIVRCGNPEDQRLRAFVESHSLAEKLAQDELHARLSCVRQAQRTGMVWRDLGAHLETSVFEDEGTEELHGKTDDKASKVLLQWAPVRGASSENRQDMHDPLFLFARALEMLAELKTKFDETETSGDDMPIKCAAGLVQSSSRAMKMLQGCTRGPKLEHRDLFAEPEIGALLGSLTAGVEHWTATRQGAWRGRSMFLLGAWLSGLVPPPRCKASTEEGCMLAALAEGAYCLEVHGCVHAAGCSVRRTKVGDGRVKFCDNHRCMANSDASRRPRACAQERVQNGSFCPGHSCAGCLFVKANPIKGQFPNACEDHQCKHPHCNQLQLGPDFAFCRDHCCVACLANGALDVAKLPGSQLCAGHKCGVGGCHRLRALSVANDGSLMREGWCEMHGCTACPIGSKTQVDLQFAGARLCVEHRCSFDPAMLGLRGPLCHHLRLQGSSFCRNHTCRMCAASGQPLTKHVVGLSPRNVCEFHPLCNAMIGYTGQLCAELAETAHGLSLRCAAHSRAAPPPTGASKGSHNPRAAPSTEKLVQLQCSGVAKKGKQRCQTKDYVPSSQKTWFCNPHADQAPESSSSSSSGSESDNEDAYGDASNSWQPVNQSMEQLPEGAFMSGFAGSPATTGAEYDVAWAVPYEDADEAQRRKKGKAPADQKVGNILHSGAGPSGAAAGVVPEMQGPSQAALNFQVSQNTDACKGTLPTTVANTRIPLADNTTIPSATLTGAAAASPISDADMAPVDADMAPVDADMAPSEHCEPPAAKVEQWEEPVGADVHPDEMDVFDETDDEVEETNEEQERLRDMIGRGSDSSASDTDSEYDDTAGGTRTNVFPRGAASQEGDEDGLASMDLESFVQRVQRWGWEMPIKERWRSAALFLKGMSLVLDGLRAQADAYLEEGRKDKAQAAAQSFKQARVVGATVVGAARRLEALRAAEPFAMVVEEACEVMEPMLMAVLSVRSLRKLELVGDHRQLPAFVQNCWFNLEATHPTIKISLFERLVTGGNLHRRFKHHPDKHAAQEAPATVSCTVLDEQRRMRPAIADLTRQDYSDLVVIQDHPVTQTRLLGDVNNCDKSTLNKFRELWFDKGLAVPGVQPQEFFWDLPRNAEGRPVAGLSACNLVEAEAAVGLTQWLVTVGVPRGSITIITPYKGQKTAIIHALRKQKLLPKPEFHQKQDPRSKQTRLPDLGSQVMVSTVDRYQGDENDVVILSLVRTRPGNRFVALHNRFIVAASRARLGFYVVGSRSAVTTHSNGSSSGPKHWRRLVEQLSQPASAPDSEEAGYSNSRVGSSLPICCPWHPKSQKKIERPEDFPNANSWGKFCSSPCACQLAWCGHACASTCHAYSPATHTAPASCPAMVAHPCARHATLKLKCGDVYKSTVKLPGSTLADALAAYECQERVEVTRPECTHKLTLNCFKNQQLESGSHKLPLCAHKVGDFYHPQCNHVTRAPKCSDRQAWEAHTPQCQVKVTHTRPCGCSAEMQCWQMMLESETPTKCMCDVQAQRPRCTHVLSMRCYEADALRSIWESQAEESASRMIPADPNSVMVEHGQSYGPCESELAINHAHVLPRHIATCHVRVRYRAPCSHIIPDVPCNRAFRWAEGDGGDHKCTTKVSLQSPLCGHKITTQCWITTAPTWPSTPLMQGSIAPTSTHESKQKDCLQAELIVAERTLMELDQLSAEVQKVLHGLCKGRTMIRRLRCGHLTSLPCSQLVNVIKTKVMPPCKEPHQRQLGCGHSITVACHLQDHPQPPPCLADVADEFVYACGRHGVHPGTCQRLAELKSMAVVECPEHVRCTRFRCGHSATVLCAHEEALTKPQPGARVVAVSTSLGIPEPPVVKQGVEYCDAPSSPEIPNCAEKVAFQYSKCGHLRQDVLCHQAFLWAAADDDDQEEEEEEEEDGEPEDVVPPCAHPVEVESPLCKHTLKVTCGVAQQLQKWHPWGESAEIPWGRISIGFDEHGDPLVQLVVPYDTSLPRPTPLLVGIPASALECGKKCVVTRACGHTCEVPCANVYKALDSTLCTERVPVTCAACQHVTHVPCHVRAAQVQSGVLPKCKRKVPKQCVTCRVNIKTVECFRQDVLCRQEATAELPCGHSATWVCGSETDPRANPDAACVACIFPLWEAALQKEPVQQPKNDTLVDHLRKHALNALPASAVVRRRLDFKVTDTAALQDARQVVVRAYHDVLRESLDNNSPTADIRRPPELADVSNFDVVFKVLASRVASQSPQMSTLQKSTFSSAFTLYGDGVELGLLSSANLAAYPASSDGYLYICMGVAFRHRALEDSPPFRVKGSKGSKVKKAVLKTVSKHRGKGIDFVISKTPGDAKTIVEVPQIEESRIYWVNGATLPLSILTLQLHNQCMICMDHVAADGGCTCCTDATLQHFTCWGCFMELVKSAQAPDATRRTVDAEGNLKCPDPSCSMVYGLHQVAVQASEEVLKQYPITEELVKLRAAATLNKALPEAIMEERKRMTAEFERIQSIQDRDERAAEVVRMDIVENILTLRCPNPECRAAFYDFDGCFAVTCTKCMHQFCGWCLKGGAKHEDMHGHVAQCKEGKGMFAPFSEFQAHHHQRQGRFIQERLAKELPDVRAHLKQKLQKDLADRDGKRILIQ